MTSPTPAPPSAARRRSTKGAKMLTGFGVLLCVGAIVLGVVVARQFAGLLPLDVLGEGGAPGSGVVGTVEAPGSAQIELEADRYAIVIAQPGASDDGEQAGELAGELRVTAPDGSDVSTGGTQVSLTTERGGVVAHSVGAFEAVQPGTYTVTAPRMADGSQALVMLTPDRDFAPFFGGIFATIFGTFGAILLGMLGIGVSMGGIIWWVVARQPARPAPGYLR